MKIKWNPDELALSDIGPLKASDFWDELASRLVPAVEANEVSGLTNEQAQALESALQNHDVLDIFMQFSGMAGLVGQKKSEKTTENLSKQLAGKNISDAQAAAEAWLKLLSHDARNLYTILLHSRLALEAVPSDIWRMANELMLRDEIEFQISDIEENNKTLIDQVRANHQEVLDEIEKEQQDTIKYDEDGRLYEIDIEIEDSNDLGTLLRRPRVKPPVIDVESEEEAKTVLNYIVDHKGLCAIPVIECSTPEHIEAIEMIKNLLDIVRHNPEGMHEIEAFLNPEANAFKAPVLQPKPPMDLGTGA